MLLLINLPSVNETSIVDCLLSLLDNKSIIKYITHSLLLILPFFSNNNFFTFSSADNSFFSRYSTFTSNFSSRLFNSCLSNDIIHFYKSDNVIPYLWYVYHNYTV